MKKTHKKILGLTGLGLVAATTAVAATMPAPFAAAMAGVSDQLQVRVTSVDPEVTVSSASGSEITSPEYSFKVLYNHVSTITATLVNRDNSGNIIQTAVVWDENVNWVEGEKEIPLNLDNYGGYGNYTITVRGLGQGNVPIEKAITVTYKKAPQEDTDVDEDGNAEVDVDVPMQEVEKVVVKIYDESGTLIKEVPINDPKEVDNINLKDLGLPDGTYTLEVESQDENGNTIGTPTTTTAVLDADSSDPAGSTVPVKIEKQDETVGKAVIVVKDSEGNIKATIPVTDLTPGAVQNIDISTLPAGDYTITVEYYDQTETGVIGTSTMEITKSDPSGNIEVDVQTKVDTVTMLEAYVYDSDGELVRIVKADRNTGTVYVYDADNNLLFTVENGYENGSLTVPMTGLESDDYTTVITYKDASGKIVGKSTTVKIEYKGGNAIVVPDTGSFFQGLNISREDYLITGMVAFALIGVAALVVLKRNRGSQTSKKSRR